MESSAESVLSPLRPRTSQKDESGGWDKSTMKQPNATSIRKAVKCIKLMTVSLVSLFCVANGTKISTTLPPAPIDRNGTEGAALFNKTDNFMSTMKMTMTTMASQITINATNSTAAPAEERDLMSYASVQIFFGILYAFIFVVGIAGNVLVCYVVFRNKAMQTVTNYFITNLALSDILLCILAVPLTPLYAFLGRWSFGEPLCHILPYAQGCSVYISTLTLTAVAIDRFFVIIYPFQPRMKLSVCIGIIVSIWIFALLVTLPYGLYMQILEDQGQIYCEENWSGSTNIKITFSICTTMLQFTIPFIVIAFCYVCVSIKLNDRARSKPGSKTSKREEADRDRKKRTNRMLIAMVAVFGISWMPLNVYNIGDDLQWWGGGEKDSIYSLLIFFITHAIAMSSTCYNPFLYAYLNENFRKEFIQILPCLFRALSPLNGGSGSGPGSSRNNNHNRSRRCLGPTSTYDPERLNDHHNNNHQQQQQDSRDSFNGTGNGASRSDFEGETQQKLLNNCDSEQQVARGERGSSSVSCQKQQKDSVLGMCSNVLLKRTRDPQGGKLSQAQIQIPLVDPVSSCTSSSCTTATSSSTISTGHQGAVNTGKATVSQLSPQYTTVDTTVVSTHSGSGGILETHFEESPGTSRSSQLPPL